ncbi:MAG: oxidoreductase [Moraxellaceae bacterium]|nr:oxidoreductase [Moraxellaceae bacterium]
MAKILIAGCGDVGSRLATRLAAEGHTVFGLRRAPFALPGVTALSGDVTDPDSLRFPAGLDYLFVLLAPGESGEAAYRHIYFEGTRHVLAALVGQRLRRVFWISSTSVYGQDDGSDVDETSPTEPASATARVLLESEALVRTAAWPATVVRFAGIYGAGRLRLLRWVEAAKPVTAEPPQWTNRIHADDAAGLLAFLLAQDARGVALADTYIGTDDEPAPQHEVLDWLADRCGLPRVPQVRAPAAGRNKRLRNARIRTLGYRFRYPDYRSGYAAVLQQPD